MTCEYTLESADFTNPEKVVSVIAVRNVDRKRVKLTDCEFTRLFSGEHRRERDPNVMHVTYELQFHTEEELP